MSKRSLIQDHDEDQDGTTNINKRIKITYELVDLPVDILHSIFSYLTSEDIANVSMIDSYYRQNFILFLFNRIKTTWHNLLAEFESKANFFLRYKYLIEQVRIIDCYSYGEWHINIFDNYLNLLPNLTRVIINSNNSSNWIKYRQNEKIHQLTLYLDKDHFETQHLQNQPRNVSVKPLASHSIQPRIFHIDHIKDFPCLRKLNLDNYHFNWEVNESSSSFYHLVELNLTNCTWEYPFKLSQFNMDRSTLAILNIKYFSNNSFILSERFNEFLLNLEENFQSLANLQLTIDQDNSINPTQSISWERRLPSNIFDKILNKSYFPYLKHVKLFGWYINLSNVKNSLRKLDVKELNHIEVINLKRVNNINNNNSNDNDDQDLAILHDILDELMTYSIKLITN